MLHKASEKKKMNACFFVPLVLKMMRKTRKIDTAWNYLVINTKATPNTLTGSKTKGRLGPGSVPLMAMEPCNNVANARRKRPGYPVIFYFEYVNLKRSNIWYSCCFCTLCCIISKMNSHTIAQRWHSQIGACEQEDNAILNSVGERCMELV